MAQQTINIGAAPDDGTGDTLRVGGDKINDNFTELYAADAALGTASALDVDPDDTLAADSDSLIPTQQAVKAYVDAAVGGPAITELDDVPDVNAPTPSNGDVLTWDSTPGEWVASPPAGGTFDLDDATDVNAPSPSNGDVLTWDSTPGEWVAAVPASGGDPDPDGNAALTKPLAASFTLENAGTASMADGTNGLVLTAPSATVNARFIRYTAGIPGASWTLTMRGRVIGPQTANVHALVIMVRNSTNGRLLTFGNNTNVLIGCNRWASYTSASTSPFSYAASVSETPWRRVSSDGTTLSFYVSCDGEEWSLIGTEAIASYLTATGGGSLDQVGVGLFFGAASTVGQKHIFQHFTLV